MKWLKIFRFFFFFSVDAQLPSSEGYATPRATVSSHELSGVFLNVDVPTNVLGDDMAQIGRSMTPSQEEVIAFGGVQPLSGVRSSARLQAKPDADAPMMERAMARAQQRDDLQTQGMSSKRTSVLSFSADEIVSRANNLGVPMGEIGRAHV